MNDKLSASLREMRDTADCANSRLNDVDALLCMIGRGGKIVESEVADRGRDAEVLLGWVLEAVSGVRGIVNDAQHDVQQIIDEVKKATGRD